MDVFNENATSSSSSNVGFFDYMTTFDTKNKNDIMNMFQYTILLILPVILLDKGIGELFSPEVDGKTNIELLLELFSELLLLISGMYYAHRIVSYIPTYSNQPYDTINFISILFVFVIIVFTFQTSLRTKADVLLERLHDYVFGISKEGMQENNKNENNKKSTPSQNNQQSQQSITENTSHVQQQQPQMQQTSPYHNQSQQPQIQHVQEPFEPIAANEGMSLNMF